VQIEFGMHLVRQTVEPSVGDRSFSVKGNSSRNFRHHSGAEANILGIHNLRGAGTTADCHQIHGSIRLSCSPMISSWPARRLP
jgi:hypothetical protein